MSIHLQYDYNYILFMSKKDLLKQLEFKRRGDPLGILKATREVVLQSQNVFINLARLGKVTNILESQIKQKKLLTVDQFGIIDQTENGAQLVFLEDVVNFSFWPDHGKRRWVVKNSEGNLVNGWIALACCFQRALKKGVPFLDADYLIEATFSDWEDFFQGEAGTQIPLLKERVQNLREAAKVLQNKYQGHFKNVVETSGFDAIKLVQIIVEEFPSFRDIVTFEGMSIPFLKRAQIVAYDLSLMFEGKSWGNLGSIDKLTAFADYKIPQILRGWQLLEYSNALAKKVDNMQEIPQGSREEVEIRAATIWTIELIRRNMTIKVIPAQVDNALWVLSHNAELKLAPYHRTRSVYY